MTIYLAQARALYALSELRGAALESIDCNIELIEGEVLKIRSFIYSTDTITDTPVAFQQYYLRALEVTGPIKTDAASTITEALYSIQQLNDISQVSFKPNTLVINVATETLRNFVNTLPVA